MALIQVTPETLEQKASELRGYREEHLGTMEKIRSLVNGTNEIWRGEAQDAYVEKFRSMQNVFNNFSEMLEGYAKLMDVAAKEFRARDEELKNTMNSYGN